MDDKNKIIPIRRREIVGEAGGLVDQTRVTLALYADDLDPDEVSRLLGAQPTTAHRRGARRSERSPPYKQGAWLLTVEAQAPTGPDDLVSLLLQRLPSGPEFWGLLQGKYTLKVIFGIFQNTWNRGFNLRAETVQLLAATGAVLEFDIYCNRPDDR